MNPNIELWHDIALIKDDKYFTKWVRQEGKLAHHTGFLDYLKPFLGGVMLDVGGNIGTHSIYYSEFGHVHSFEPNPIAFECLVHNMQGTNSTLYNVAVGAESGYISMTTPENGNYGAVYTQPHGEIPVITIDSMQLDACDFIKIDVEGDEVAVLQGAAETIKKFKPTMCIESNPSTLVRKGLSANDLVAAIHLLGYTTKQRVPLDISCDLLCFPPGR